ncbi:MAG: TIGR01212 family radical SAM protein [Thermotogota bacterium]
MKNYNNLSTYLKNRYGERVQRLPINAGFTCPNKTGEKGYGGCIFCEKTGSGFASTNASVSIKNQLKKMMKRYEGRASKYMAYFQSNTNTYADPHKLKEIYDQALISDDILILDISTRPDCVSEKKLDIISSYKNKLDVFLEFGVESTNTKTLVFMNRGHYLSDVIDATMRSKKRDLEIIYHFIMDFPTDDINDVIEMAKFANVMEIQGVKLHSLYITENTKLGKMYKNGEISPLSLDEYINRVITFLEHLNPDIVIHRLAAEPPKTGYLHGNWGFRKIEIINKINREIKERNTYQGIKYKE